ncbi:MAG: hypothetical protein IJE81_05870 [Oscillospiraceae bacterium]|nr:hypothetical protein [Oscillospiraceae bacterium]
MKKSDFTALVIGVPGGLLFSLGLCMCLLPEWNAFRPGVVCTAVGLAILLILILVRCKKAGRKLHISWKLTGKIAFGILGALVLGTGMCMVMVWNMILPGIAVGMVGIVLLLCLIPMFVGLK